MTNLHPRDPAQSEDSEWTPWEVLAACRYDHGPIPLRVGAALERAYTPVPRRISPLLRRWTRGARRYAAAKAGAPEPDVPPVLTLIRGGGRRARA